MVLSDLAWGLQMMLVGMGVVFLLLIALMGVLLVIGRMDRPDSAVGTDSAPRPAALEVHADPDGRTRITATDDSLDADTLAAIAVAVITHAEHRRRLAGPEVRAFAPGSQLFASRWVSVGRAHQTQPFRKS